MAEHLRRFVIFHDPDGRFRLAAETRAAEIRRGMADLGKTENVDFTVDVHSVSRASQVSRALKFGNALGRGESLRPPATSVDFFHHSSNQAIFLDVQGVGAETNLALGGTVRGTTGTGLSSTPFRKALANVQPWGEVNVHGCNFGRAEGRRQPAGGRQLADCLDVIVSAYSNPGGTIFTQDPALASGRRTATASDAEGRGVTDRTKPVWMVPLRDSTTTHRRTFVPRSMVDWIQGRGPYLAPGSSAAISGHDPLGIDSMGVLHQARARLAAFDPRLYDRSMAHAATSRIARVRLDPGLGARIGVAGTQTGGLSTPPSYTSALDDLRRRMRGFDPSLTGRDAGRIGAGAAAYDTALSASRMSMLDASRARLARFDPRLYDRSLAQAVDPRIAHMRLDPGLGARISAAGAHAGGLSGPPSYGAALDGLRRRLSGFDTSLRGAGAGLFH